MIPMACSDETNKTNEKLLIGHNVAFDRSFVKDAYQLKVSMGFCQFFDTK